MGRIAAGLGITAPSLALARRNHRGASRPARLERALLAIHGTILVAFVLVSVAPLLDAGEVPWQQLFPRILIAVIYLTVALDLQLRGERLEHLLVLVFPLLVVAALESAPLAGDVASGLTVGALSLSAARQLRPLGYAALMIPAGLAHGGARVAVGGSLDAAMSDVVVGVGMTYAVYAFVEALHRAAERSAAADAETGRLRREAAEDDARRRAVETAGRALHDDVLVALRAAADPTRDRARVREACARAVLALEKVGTENTATDGSDVEATDDSRSLDALVREIRAASTIAVDIDRRESVQGLAIPGPTFDVAVRVVGEALRNVERHSGVNTAAVTLECVGTDLTIVVVDHGAGRPDEFTRGFGTSTSIIGAAASAGGAAELRATPGGGTTVAVRLPLRDRARPSILRRSYEMTVRATGSAQPIAQITWPVALVWVYMAIRYSFQWPTPAVSLLLAVAYVAATFAVVHRIVRRAPTVTWLVVVASALVGLDAVSLAVAPDGSLLDYRSWTMGFLAVPLVALLMVLPARVALVVHAPHVLLVLVFAALDPALSDGVVPWGSLNALLATPVAALVLGRLMRRIGLHIEREEQSQARLAKERAERRSQAAVFALHLDHTRRTVLPWLSDVADGRTEPGDVGAVEQARLLALDVRDDLYAPGFLSPEVRAELREFRQRGGSLTLRPGLPSGPSGRAVSAIVSRLVRDLDAAHGITITPTRSARSAGARVAVVPPAPDRVARSFPNADVRTDPYRTVLTVREGVGSRRRGAEAPASREVDLQG